MVRDDAAAAGADWLAARLAEAIAARGRASLALSGGTGPRPLYQELARRPVEWGRVTVVFVDERCVPPDHEKSNYRMAAEALLHRAPPASLHRMPGERSDREAAADDYALVVPDAIDVMVLGVGDDGHTASLFPGTDWSRPTGRKTLATTSPVAPHPRLTLSPDAIRRAQAVLVQVAGAAKAAIAKIALEGERDPARWPIHLVRDAVWLLDPPAASQVSKELLHG
jgi:6-phosphogluconolactonase